MKLSDLTEVDNSLTLIHSASDWDENIDGISSWQNPRVGTFVFAKNKKFLSLVSEKLSEQVPSNFGLVLEKSFYDSIDNDATFDQLVQSLSFLGTVDDVEHSMCLLSEPFYQEKFGSLNDMVDGRQMGTVEVDPSSWIAQNVFLGEGVVIGKNVKIYSGVSILGKSIIGDNTVIYPNTTIYPYVDIGHSCRIHAQCAIGVDGFGYNFRQGVHQKIWHIGDVLIGNNVEIGAGVCIDRGTFDNTIIGAGCRIDNQVQIAHNCQLGTGVVICGQSGLAGSVGIGDFTLIGGSSKVIPDVQVGAQCQVGGFSGVTGNLADKSVVAGFPARPVKEWLRSMATLRKLSKKS
jgi:UDP-3-O-[3-hydroxymyristoyl] glucosamine N-acyltransferase